MTRIYEPDADLSVSGDAAEVDRRCQNANVEIVGSVASASGDVKQIVTNSPLSTSELDALESEFAVSWSEMSLI